MVRSFSVLLLTLFASLSAAAAERSQYILLLHDPAPATQAAAGRAAIEAASRALAAPHALVKSALRAKGFEVIGEADLLLNAVFVSADASRVNELKSIPGVDAVVKSRRYKMALDRAEQLINVPAAWSLLNGVSQAGAGVKIGIIDTGIQTSHPAFQDPALTAPSGYPVCSVAGISGFAFDCTQYTNSKVIVARSYVPYVAQGSGSNPAANSRPDDYTPRDRTGHGTAVAMAAAGWTNSGPADTITGVAPKAWLGSYKVFGSPQVNPYASGIGIIAALQDAYRDGMDIAVLSLGQPALSGPLDTGNVCGVTTGSACDTEASAVQNAVTAGMIVVVAAGNTGGNGSVTPTLTSVTSPATAPNAIAVGASTNSHDWSDGLSISGLGNFNAQLGDELFTGPNFTGPITDVANVGDPLACSAEPAGSLTGTIALLSRGTCTFATKIQNVQAAGATGAIIYNNPGDDTLLTPGGLAGVTTMPVTFVGYDDGQTIRTYLQSNPKATATISANLQPFNVTTGNQVASFSSRGPALGTYAVKPDVAAPGTAMYLAGETYDPNGELYSANGYLVSQGTSFAAPLVAGVAALVKQANPGLRGPLAAMQIRSAVVNTATQDVTDGGAPASVLAVGAGKVNAAAAVAANVVAQPTSLSFGVLKTNNISTTQQISLTNLSSAQLTLSLAINRTTPDTTAAIALDRGSLTLSAGQSLTFNVSLTGTLPAPGIYEGRITVTGGASTLQIPYVYIVGNGVPYNIVPLIGDGDDGTVSQLTAEGILVIQVLDKYGVPVSGVPVRWSVLSGGGRIGGQDTSTDVYGLAGAQPYLGPTPGTNTYTATAGGLSTSFSATAQLQPAISTGGIVDAASYSSGAIAPGSYVAIFGNNFASATQISSTPFLPVAMNNVSVSFDTSTVSAPGHVYYVSPGQVNVQVPWELAGASSALVKVSYQDSPGTLYTMPLATYAPSMFQYSAGNVNYVDALDSNYKLITTSNPAKQGQPIQIYCNGLGPVTNPPASGDPSPSQPLSTTTSTPTVTIGGQNATVLFSGLTPTAIGLYQINVMVPNTGAGTQTVQISIGGVNSQTLSLPVQ